jgi:hypothetical protein
MIFKFIGMPAQAIPIVIPFARWHEAANNEQFTNQPRKH